MDASIEYRKVNLNPSGKKTGDCVIRAVAGALNISWSKALDELTTVAQEIHDCPTMKATFDLLLTRNGFVKMPMPKINGRRVKLADAADFLGKGNHVVGVIGHVAHVKDGVLNDTWDCRRKCLGNYWKK